MKIPKELKIGGKWYTIELLDKIEFEGVEDPNGLIQFRQNKIFLNKNMTESETEVTLLHEIIHAIDSNMHEQQVELTAQLLYTVFVDNDLRFTAPKGKVK